MLSREEKSALIVEAVKRSPKHARELREHIMEGRNPNVRPAITDYKGFIREVSARGGSRPRVKK